MRYLVIMLTTVFLATVAAVGVSAVDSPVAEAAGGGYVKKCGGGEIKLNAREKETFLLHNKIRNNRNLKPFCVHPKLQQAARSHSKDMIQRGYFSHNTKGRGSFKQRLKRFGYRGYAGENIAHSSGRSGDPSSIMEGWMNSSGHRSNILSGNYREIGIGAHTGDYNNFRTTMYTVDFGTCL
ncbi:MAG: CAP domain-containing protein [Rubrobacter sp.]|nr:CAP domain-containing protein [Rubrobacter sp.]